MIPTTSRNSAPRAVAPAPGSCSFGATAAPAPGSCGWSAPVPPASLKPSLRDVIFPQLIGGGHPPTRSRVHDPHFEAVAIEPEVTLDPPHQTLDRRVAPDRPTAA